MASWKSFRPLAGCGLFLESNGEFDAYERFPSPCGVWVVSTQICDRLNAVKVSVPLRGVGCFRQGAASATGYQGFPSPCGVWVVSSEIELILIALGFRPLAGCGLFLPPSP